MCETADGIDATVVITTKDRKDDLRRAVQSAVEQTAGPEILVVDDGSEDGTSEMIREEFPDVRVHRAEESAGYIIRRNQGAEMAKGSIVFSIDDDAEFSSPRIVEQVLAEFDHPRIGAVAIPYVDVKRESGVQQKAPEGEGRYCTSTFRGTAYALRRDLFLRQGGYREHLVHQGEEMDYCIRMLDSGYAVRLGCSDIIKHYESPRRSLDRMDFYGRRNDVLFGWHNVPAQFLGLHLFIAFVNLFRTVAREGRITKLLAGTMAGLRDCVKYFYSRDPVGKKSYRLYRELRRSGPCKLKAVRNRLEKICHSGQ
ncbi:glycosyltransferase involved in cell wall biosynthesis [Salinibacter ruber]|uniref:glycosyltransferase family 2 protein n=1 Tax=Salinibacter ruber TaxID=146919 RepID=UPI00216858CC|nr:glycosyltransferase [Salinibacter ruber]MCS3748875.1 glycosyltransferase involved in cell wall biosynthesis [Salinibacter ruber]